MQLTRSVRKYRPIRERQVRKPNHVAGGEKVTVPVQDAEQAILLDVPIQARALACLSSRERVRYRRARHLLSLGEGTQALVRADLALSGLGVYEALLAR